MGEYRGGHGAALLEQVERYFKILDDDSITLQYNNVRANSHSLGPKHQLDRTDDTYCYNELYGKGHPIIRNY